MRIREFVQSLFRSRSWTCADQTQAILRGWGMFDSEDGEGLLLQATDERCDYWAWIQVEADAGRGDPLSKKALSLLERRNPEEHRTVMIFAEKHRRRG